MRRRRRGRGEAVAKRSRSNKRAQVTQGHKRKRAVGVVLASGLEQTGTELRVSSRAPRHCNPPSPLSALRSPVTPITVSPTEEVPILDPLSSLQLTSPASAHTRRPCIASAAPSLAYRTATSPAFLTGPRSCPLRAMRLDNALFKCHKTVTSASRRLSRQTRVLGACPPEVAARRSRPSRCELRSRTCFWHLWPLRIPVSGYRYSRPCCCCLRPGTRTLLRDCLFDLLRTRPVTLTANANTSLSTRSHGSIRDTRADPQDVVIPASM